MEITTTIETTLKISYAERRNLAFAFISGRNSVENPIYKVDPKAEDPEAQDPEAQDPEAQLVLQEFEDFLRRLPDLIKIDEVKV